jgi:thiol:disulfide interchange protein
MSGKRSSGNSFLRQLLIVTGLALLVAIVLMVKYKPQAVAPFVDLPEEQLQRALAAGKPTLGFYHSDNCKSCIEMMGIVYQVYPEFSDSVALIDINVYAEENRTLLLREQVQYIPTLIFYDRKGTREISVGVMETEMLRQKLNTIKGSQ